MLQAASVPGHLRSHTLLVARLARKLIYLRVERYKQAQHCVECAERGNQILTKPARCTHHLRGRCCSGRQTGSAIMTSLELSSQRYGHSIQLQAICLTATACSGACATEAGAAGRCIMLRTS